MVNAIKAGDDALAKELLSHLKEPNQTRLGQSTGKTPRGRGVGHDQAGMLFEALSKSQAVKTGFLTDLEDCALLIDGFGPDKISDVSTNVIRRHLIEYTKQQCRLWNVPMQNVAAGNIWEGGTKSWTGVYADLPLCYEKPVLLVPKAIVRRNSVFDGNDYYRHEVVDFLQAEEFSSPHGLVRLLKSGQRQPPFKKDVKKKHPYSKKYLYEFSKDHPQVLHGYKSRKGGASNELTDEQLLDAQEIEEKPDWNSLSKKLDSIPVGNAHAAEYHNHVLGVLEAVLYPSLVYPRKETEIDQGRKRVDITFENADKSGFFFDLHTIKKIASSYIFVECKNYKEDVANPELDQLTGRFDIQRGQFGMIVCRKIDDKDLFHARCRDAALKRQQFVIALDDADLKELIEIRKREDAKAFDKFFADRLIKITL